MQEIHELSNLEILLRLLAAFFCGAAIGLNREFHNKPAGFRTFALVSLGSAVAVGVGASLDFIAGMLRRAPRWMSDAGLEWAFRLAQEPRRLAGRYLLRDPQFFRIVARQMRAPD